MLGGALSAAMLLAAGRADALPPVQATFRSASADASLTFGCGSSGVILSAFGLPKGWGTPTPELRVGSRHFRMRAVPGKNLLLLSDRRAPADGVSRALISAAKSGRIDLVGRGSEGLQPGLRVFRLDHARARIETVEAYCSMRPAPCRVAGTCPEP